MEKKHFQQLFGNGNSWVVFSVTVWLAGLTMIPALVFGGEYADTGPDPVQWRQEPHAYISTEVVMQAEPIDYPELVEYRFECVNGDGHSSSWLQSPSYKDKGLSPETSYTYVVKVRDKKDRKTVASDSSAISVTTRRDGSKTDRGHIAAIEKAIATGEIELIPLMITGDKDNRINIIAINRWERDNRSAYNKASLREEFIEDARHIVNAFTAGSEHAIPPYPAYRNFFNIYAIWWPDMPPWKPDDRQIGMSHSDYNEIRARFFLPWQNEGRGWVTHLAMLNGGGGGGGAALTMDKRFGNAMIVGNEITSFIHEFNHTAPGIPDEYTSSGMWGRGGEISSATNEYRRNMIRWRAWIAPDTPVPTPYSIRYKDKVGAFEGGQSRLTYMYRPTARGCLMGSGSFTGPGDQLCVVCRQRAVTRCYRWVNALEKTYPARKELKIKGAQTVRFAVQRVKPQPDTQIVEWRLNGRLIAAGVVQVDVTFGPLKEYELECHLRDESVFVKHDPPYSHYPREVVTWKVSNLQPSMAARPLQVRLKGRDPVFAGTDDGLIQTEVSGGRPPYIYNWNDKISVRDREMLDAGSYTLTVTDSDFQTTRATIELKREDEIDPQLTTTLQDGSWDITINGVEKTDVSCKWSNGVKGNRISGAADGGYSCTIKHKNGSKITRQVTLKTPTEKLKVQIKEVLPSCGGRNNGTVILEVTGGRPPYRFLWSDGLTSDQPERHFIIPGEYFVTVKDTNRSMVAITKTITVKDEPGFTLSGVQITIADKQAVEIVSPQPDYRYLWYESDYPPQIPLFPHGLYKGSYTGTDAKEYYAEAYVVQNKAGVFVDTERKRRNNLGYWIHFMAYIDGTDAMPIVYEVNTRGRGKFDGELTIESRRSGDVTWNGKVAAGKMTLQAKGGRQGRAEMFFASHPDQPDEPLHIGNRFVPPRGGNYYVAARKISTGAISTNRVGFAITVGKKRSKTAALAPDKAKRAQLLLWLDSSDMDGDGKEDSDLPVRRGAVLGWKSKTGDINFGDFVNFQPNQQNGKGVACWDHIWLQWMNKRVGGFQTIFMVRREHDFSSVGTAPWRGLSRLIGIGEYGKRLMSGDVSERIRKGAVYLDGEKVDPLTAQMPEGFYLVTYEFDQKINRGFNQTDGHWEGSLAECLVYDGKLTQAERSGVEEYLRAKWLSSVHLER